MTDVEPPRPYFSLSLADGSTQTFDNIDELRTWVAQQKEHWTWIRGIAGDKLGIADDQRKLIHNLLNPASTMLEQPDQQAINLGQVKANLDQYAKLDLVSGSLRSDFISSLRERFGDVTGTAAVAAYLGCLWVEAGNIPRENRYPVRLGRNAIVLFDMGLGKHVTDAYRSGLQKLTNSFATRSEKQIVDARLELATIKAERDQATADRASWMTQSEKNWQEILERFNQEGVSSIDSIMNTEKAYKEQMKLRSSVQYWNAQSKKHRDQANWQKAVLIFYATAVYLVAYYSVSPFLTFAKTMASDLDGKSSAPLLILTGAAVFVVSIVLWAARILVRIYMEERHRVLDAS